MVYTTIDILYNGVKVFMSHTEEKAIFTKKE